MSGNRLNRLMTFPGHQTLTAGLTEVSPGRKKMNVWYTLASSAPSATERPRSPARLGELPTPRKRCGGPGLLQRMVRRIALDRRASLPGYGFVPLGFGCCFLPLVT